MKVLGIESSCDETGVALVEAPDDPAAPPRLLAEALHTQAAMHADYGGVVPELASRDHIRRVLPLLERVLAEAGAAPADIGLVAYTRGPGLAGALLVGAGVAVSLAAALGRPALGVHHLEGHLLSPFLGSPAPAFPFVALLVSGGAAGLAGALEVAGPLGQLTPYVPAGYGFAAIIVAFVGRLHPVGMVFSAILMSMFYIGGELAQSRMGLPKSLTGVFQGLLLFTLLACDTLIAYRVRWVGARKEVR